MTDAAKYDDAGIRAIFDFSFRRFITLSVIKVLFVLGLALIALTWVVMLIGAFAQGGAVAGLLMLVLGTLMAGINIIFLRVWLELIVFRIGENTTALVDHNRGPAVTTIPIGT